MQGLVFKAVSQSLRSLMALMLGTRPAVEVTPALS